MCDAILFRTMDSNPESITERFRSLRMRADLSLAELAKRMGFKGASSIQRYESAGSYSGGYLKRDLVAALEKAVVGRGAPPITRAEIWELAGPEFASPEVNATLLGKIDAPTKLANLGRVDKIPLYGQAVGGVHGEFVLNGNHLDDIFTPPVLSGVQGAYAVGVAGDSMEPRYFDGEVVYVHPRKRVVRGSFVVAQIRNPNDAGNPLAYVKRFVRWNESAGLVLEQFNPSEELVFPHTDVVSVHLVVMGGMTSS